MAVGAAWGPFTAPAGPAWPVASSRATRAPRSSRIRTPRPVLALVVVLAVAGAALPLHGAPPALAGSRFAWHVESAVVLALVLWPLARALVLAYRGLWLFVD